MRSHACIFTICFVPMLIPGGATHAATEAVTAAPAPPESALAASGQLPAMTLSEALAYARQYQPTLRAAQARLEAARRAVTVVRSEWLPQVGATAQVFYGTMNNSTAMYLGVRTLDLSLIHI